MKTLILGDLCPGEINNEYFKKLDIDTLFTDVWREYFPTYNQTNEID